MNITPLKQILPPARTRNSRGVGFNRLTAFRFALLMLAMFGSFGLTQAQQTDPLTITPEGKVGIGTTAPANKLSVAGNADVSGKLDVGGDIQITNRNKIILADEHHGLRYRYFGNDDIDGPILYGYSGGALGFSRPNKADQKIVLRWSDNGNVGIGTTGPANNRLSVTGNADFSGKVGIGKKDPARALDIFSSDSGFGMLRVNNDSTTAGEATIGFFDTNASNNGTAWVAGVGGWSNTGDFVIGNGDGAGGGNVKMLIQKDGIVGIGTTTPGKGKLEIFGTASGDKPGFSSLKWLNHPNGVQTGGNPREELSMYANGPIGVSAVFVFSDARIKNIRGRTDGAKDLETLLAIEITDYDYSDVIGKRGVPHKKVTGQQIEKVFPQAVSRSTDVVPDIYQKATIKDGWVTLSTNLKKGDRVRLIGENREGVHEVLEIADGKFRTAFAPDGDQIFVYGREVNDFRSVDYDAISMLNVSATQQIKKEKDQDVKGLQEENAALRSQLAVQEQRLSELEAKDKAREEKLAALEAMLLSGKSPSTRAASLKKVE